MHLSFRLIFLLFCCGPSALAQSRKDSVATLNEEVVSAYSYHRTLKETPVALGIVGEKELSRFNVTSMVSAMNTVPGVRMEERSPGSYRFSIRGSALRSPFGVRNVKFYWNGLPLTDGGGNTYLNLLDVEAIGKAEIIKGQGASLYGAGTGGVVLLTSPSSSKNQFQFSSSGGSFGLQRHQAGAFFANDKNRLFVNYVHQQSEGYREQSAMRRDALNLSGNYSLRNKSVLHTSVFYSDLYYQTPGGLTLAQYTVDPKQARLPSKTTAGAVQQHAAIYNKTIYGAAVYESQWASRWSTRAGLYSAYTDFTNPSILNFERRTEYNWGGRTDTRYELDKNNWKAKFTMGAEYQHFYSPLTDYGNRLGAKDTLKTDDRLTSNLIVLFAQAEFDLPHHFYFTIGSSTNFLNFNFHRLTGSQPGSSGILIR